MFKGAKPSTFEKAHALRHDTTEAKDILWQAFRKVCGCKFRRQHPVKKVILDFFCNEKNLAIEVDGSAHDGAFAKEYDENRTFELENMEIKVIRFSNEDIKTKLDEVILKIKQHL